MTRQPVRLLLLAVGLALAAAVPASATLGPPATATPGAPARDIDPHFAVPGIGYPDPGFRAHIAAAPDRGFDVHIDPAALPAGAYSSPGGP